MIGVFDYTVILTYVSLLTAGTGIAVSLAGSGHPYWGVLCLMFCGLFDAFDGRVARTKKNRTEMEKNFGIQIDSLCDIVAFGVLPACIGIAVMRNSEFLKDMVSDGAGIAIKILLYIILAAYLLAAVIRLAYYNVTEETRQKTESGVRKFYTGLPVTTSFLSFSVILLLDRLIPADLFFLYFLMAGVNAGLFVSKLQIPKPGLKGILVMVGCGLLVLLLFILSYLWF